MKLKDIGEFGFIDRIEPLCKVHSANIVRGIGDDCAVISVSPELNLLITTDLLVERVHFLLDWQGPDTLGAKALAVNLSDIAACGGTPKEAFVSIAVPDHLEINWLENFYKGMADLADKFKVSILGGDTTRSLTDLVINVAVTGLSRSGETLLRRSAQPRDVIAVTGSLGDSAAGLELLRNSLEVPETVATPLIKAHLSPSPHLLQGQMLAKSGACNAAIDISDGLSSDLNHICKQSGLGATIFEEKLPISKALRQLARRLSVDPIDWIINGGEDYVLLAAIKPDKYEELAQKALIEGYQLTEIGRFESTVGINLVRVSGEILPVMPSGWDHFRRKATSETI
ncbi:MAG: thiamine-phosphate kinase [Deltaproteobacteria bacterium]|nr:thiamine-phosphate kinase [Deltaproteobacteria bacterium]